MTADDRIKSIEYLFDNDCVFERTLDTFIEYAKCKSVLMTLIAYLESKNYEVSKDELQKLIDNSMSIL